MSKKELKRKVEDIKARNQNREQVDNELKMLKKEIDLHFKKTIELVKSRDDKFLE
jgi:uncharacterized membrane-anchored protein YhcB (DUF1043 family)